MIKFFRETMWRFIHFIERNWFEILVIYSIVMILIVWSYVLFPGSWIENLKIFDKWDVPHEIDPPRYKDLELTK